MPVTLEAVRRVVRLIEPAPARAKKLGAGALPHLRKLIQSEDISVARRAASVVTQINDRRAVAVLDLASKSPHRDVRLAAASELWRLAKHDPTKQALRLLGDPDPTIRRRTLRSLATVFANMWSKQALAQQIITMAIRDPDPSNRSLATILARRGTSQPFTHEDVLKAMASKLSTLDLVTALDPETLAHLRDIAAGNETELAARAVVVAVTLAPRAARRIVVGAANDARPQVREAAASVAELTPAKGTVLRALLQDTSPRVREMAFVAAARARLPGLATVAAKLAGSDPYPQIRAMAESYLRLRLGKPR